MIQPIKKKDKGFTLIEVLIGTALLLIVFTGIFGAYRLGLKVIGLSKNKIIATSIANAQIERIRNLPYGSVGIMGAALPFATGVIEQDSSQVVNNVTFDIQTQIKYIADSADGLGAGDACDLDYKKVDVTVSWNDNFPGRASFSTNVTPKDLVQETQSCLSQPGGVLTVRVFDGSGILVPSPTINVYDLSLGGMLVDSAVPDSGRHSFALGVGTYEVRVSKSGHTSEKTYSTLEVAVPNSLNPTVIDGDETMTSLSISPASTLTVEGISPTGQADFSDTFDDETLISEKSDVQAAGGNATLSGSPYPASGYAISQEIMPVGLVSWEELRFDNTKPVGTELSCQVLFYDGVGWSLVPDVDLSGNSAGFNISPVNIKSLDISDYPKLKIKAGFSTIDPLVTPSLHNWQVVWTTNAGIPLPNTAFHIQGTKTIGEDAFGQDVFKYSADYTLDGSGRYVFADIDGDDYTFSANATSGLSLIATDPSTQPINVVPGSAATVKLFLRAEDALLVTVQNDVTLGPVFSAEVRLTNPGIGYDKILYTDQSGQAYFSPLQSGNYGITISAAGYTGYSGTVAIAGESSQTINIHQNE